MVHRGDSSSNMVAATRLRWSEEKVLAEARKRTKELNVDNSKKLQRMLAALMVEAGWNEEEFIEVLCKDVMRKGAH